MIRKQLEDAQCAYLFRLSARHSHLAPRYAVYTLEKGGVLRLLYPTDMDLRDEELIALLGLRRSRLKKYPAWHFAPVSHLSPVGEVEAALQKINPALLVYELDGRRG